MPLRGALAQHAAVLFRACLHLRSSGKGVGKAAGRHVLSGGHVGSVGDVALRAGRQIAYGKNNERHRRRSSIIT